MACRSGGRVYAFQPLSREGAIGPADDVIRIESGPAPSPEPGPFGRADPRKRGTP